MINIIAHRMTTLLPRLLPCLLAGALLVAASSRAADMPPAAEKDPLRALLLESISKNKGVTVHTGGAAIGMVVTAIDGCCVFGRSQQSSRIVVRLDRIDAVAAAF